VKLARATGGGEKPTTGDNLFATVNFKVLQEGGATSVQVGGDSHVVRSTDAADLFGGSNAAATPIPAGAAANGSRQGGVSWYWIVLGLFGVAVVFIAAGIMVYMKQRRPPLS
jgi:hypothetical protein